MKEVNIKTEFIKLDQFLKWVGIVQLGSEAKMIILEGLVKVNNDICTQRGKKLRSGDFVEFDEKKYKLI